MNKVFVFLWLVGGGIVGPFEFETTESCASLEAGYDDMLVQYGGGSKQFECDPAEQEKEME